MTEFLQVDNHEKNHESTSSPEQYSDKETKNRIEAKDYAGCIVVKDDKKVIFESTVPLVTRRRLKDLEFYFLNSDFGPLKKQFEIFLL